MDKQACAERFTSGFVALVGRPNAGKSTLLNALVGRKLAITSPVAQTTRRRMRAVVDTERSQLVIIDTPGLHKPKDELGKELNRAALSELDDADAIAMLIAADSNVGRGDAWVAAHVQESSAPYKLLVITKADLVDSKRAQDQLEAARGLTHFDDAIVVSAKESFNLNAFISCVSAHMPEGPRWFPAGVTTDMSDEELVAEFVREKAFRNLRQEIPHSLAVRCDEIAWKGDGHASIRATILVEREGQKGIVIGRNAQMLKKIGTEARRDIEHLLDAHAYLELRVQVQPAWRRDKGEIRRLGLAADE